MCNHIPDRFVRFGKSDMNIGQRVIVFILLMLMSWVTLPFMILIWLFGGALPFQHMREMYDKILGWDTPNKAEKPQ